MATPEAQDEAAKQRIVKHLNADHKDSVRRYLEAYSNLSLFQTRDAKMTDITLNEMKFTCNGQQHSIAFDPPMKSYRDARERSVQLDKDALTILCRSDLVVDKYIPPTTKLGHLINFSTCFLCYLFLPFPSNWQPGSLLYDNVLHFVPWFASFVAVVGWWIFVAIILPVHTLEAALMARRLRIRHGLIPFDTMWWLWTTSCFIEGITSTWRLNSLLDQKRKEKDAKKH